MEFRIVEPKPATAYGIQFGQEVRLVRDCVRRMDPEFVAGEISIKPVGRHRGEQDLPHGGTVAGARPADAIGNLKCAVAFGLGNHDHFVARMHSEHAGVSSRHGEIAQDWGRYADQLNFASGRSGETEESATDEVTFSLLRLANVAECRHSLEQMEYGAAIEPHLAAQLCEAYAVRTISDRPEQPECATERLDAAPNFFGPPGLFGRHGHLNWEEDIGGEMTGAGSIGIAGTCSRIIDRSRFRIPRN